MQYSTPQHDQNTVAPCDMSFICNFTCSQGLHRIMASFLSGLHAIEQARCAGILNFPIGPFYMSHNCKLFNPGAGKLTALHQRWCLNTGGTSTGGTEVLSIYQYPQRALQNESYPMFYFQKNLVKAMLLPGTHI